MCAETAVETAMQGSDCSVTPEVVLGGTKWTNQGTTHRLTKRKDAYLPKCSCIFWATQMQIVSDLPLLH